MLATDSNRGAPGVNTRSVSTTHSAADLEVLKEIDSIYFSNPHNIDAGRYVLENCPAPTTCQLIEEMFMKLKRQQQVVSGKALHLISQQRDNCDREFKEVEHIREMVTTTHTTCREARANLHAASERLTVSTFAILANFRKRQLVKSVLKVLDLLKVLRDVEIDAAERVARKDYEGAISRVLKAREAAVVNSDFECIRSLDSRLQDTLEMTEEKLDTVLSSICRHFDEDVFRRLRRAYSLLDKLQAAMEQLHMHYSSAVNEAACEAIKPYVNNYRPEMKLQDLCISASDASNCLIDLCENLFYIMKSYYLLVDWHSKHDEESLPTSEPLNPTVQAEMNVSREYIRQKLRAGLSRIWQDVQAKVSVFLKNSGIENYPFEKFVQVLGVLRKLTQIAEVFCADKAEVLQDFIKSNSVSYIKNYHRGRLEELKLFLENEGWEPCPVKSDFNLLHLQEFKPFKRHLKSKLKLSKVYTKSVISDDHSSAPSQDDTVFIQHFFMSNQISTPFEMFRNEDITCDDIFGVDNDVGMSSEDSEDDEDSQAESKHVLIASTTLSVLRNCGQYMQICRYLPTISLDVIILMFQLYEYYMHAVHLFFTSDLEVHTSTLYTTKLNAVLKKISHNVDGENSAKRPDIPSHLVLTNEEHLHGLSDRIVAVESLVFLSKQFQIMYPYLESLVNQQQSVILEYFRDNTIKVATDLRMPVYMGTASKSVDAPSILSMMSSVKFDLKNIANEHSKYVDVIMRQLQIFALRFDNVRSGIHISHEVARSVWSAVSKFLAHLLVEGFSHANKCTPSGRMLMQLDYTQVFVKLGKISAIKSIPHQDYVDRYVKAYYLPRNLLEEFIKDRSEYSNKHILALIACAATNKKEKIELVSILECRDNIEMPQAPT